MKDIKEFMEKIDTFDKKKKLPKVLRKKLKTIDDWFDLMQQFDQCYMDALPLKLANLIEDTGISEKKDADHVALEVLSQLCICVIRHLEQREFPNDDEFNVNYFIDRMHEELSVALDETLDAQAVG